MFIVFCASSTLEAKDICALEAKGVCALEAKGVCALEAKGICTLEAKGVCALDAKDVHTIEAKGVICFLQIRLAHVSTHNEVHMFFSIHTKQLPSADDLW